MFGFLKRMSAPIVLGALILLALASIVSDRSGLRRSDLPWWQGVLLEVTVPVQKAVAIPAGAVGRFWRSYLDLVDLKADNDDLRATLLELEEANLQLREALVSSGHLEQIVEMRDGFEVPMLPAAVVGLDVSPIFSFRAGGSRKRARDPGRESGHHPCRGSWGGDENFRSCCQDDAGARSPERRRRRRSAQPLAGHGLREGELANPSSHSKPEGATSRLGDLLLTSGLGGVYPKGLKLGEK